MGLQAEVRPPVAGCYGLFPWHETDTQSIDFAGVCLNNRWQVRSASSRVLACEAGEIVSSRARKPDDLDDVSLTIWTMSLEGP